MLAAEAAHFEHYKSEITVNDWRIFICEVLCIRLTTFTVTHRHIRPVTTLNTVQHVVACPRLVTADICMAVQRAFGYLHECQRYRLPQSTSRRGV